MAKRMIHDKIWASEQFGYLSQQARLLYIGIITLADDDGRLKGSPHYLRGQIFPYDEDVSASTVEIWRDEIVAQKLITKYEVEGSTFLQHPKWSEYQTLRADRKKVSNIPSSDRVTTNRQPDVGHVTAEGKVREGKLSKDKLSKIRSKAPDERTPKEHTILFFDSVELLLTGNQAPELAEFLQQLSTSNNVPKERLWAEIKKFYNYWTELNGTGTKTKWQMQKTFMVNRRLATWFGRVGFKGFSVSDKKGKGIIE